MERIVQLNGQTRDQDRLDTIFNVDVDENHRLRNRGGVIYSELLMTRANGERHWVELARVDKRSPLFSILMESAWIPAERSTSR